MYHYSNEQWAVIVQTIRHSEGYHSTGLETYQRATAGGGSVELQSSGAQPGGAPYHARHMVVSCLQVAARVPCNVCDPRIIGGGYPGCFRRGSGWDLRRLIWRPMLLHRVHGTWILDSCIMANGTWIQPHTGSRIPQWRPLNAVLVLRYNWTQAAIHKDRNGA